MQAHCLTHILYEVRIHDFVVWSIILILFPLAELINLVRHMRAYPNDDLGTSLRNIFDFDIYKHETIERLKEILELYGWVYSCRAWCRCTTFIIHIHAVWL